MKITSVVKIAALIFAIPVGQTFAQTGVDPASAALFHGGNSPEPEDLDSSRFTVTSPIPPSAEAPKNETVIIKKKKVETTTKIEVPPTPAAALAPASVAPPTPQPAPEHPSLTDQVKVLILGNNEEIEDFHKQIHPSDSRNNRVEIAVAPTFVYEGSSSNYSFRNFTFESPGLNANAHVWLTPFFGLQVDYTSTFGATVKSPSAQQMVPLNYQDIEFGLRFRKHFGMQRKSPSLTWGLDYIQITNDVPSNSTDRVSTSTSGLSLSLQADIPHSLSYSTTLGVDLQPRLVHSETSDVNIHSGGKNETDAIGAWIGGDWIFDRQHQMFWKLNQRIEQNVFDGAASAVDPATGVTPNGVSITNSTTLFSIGYKWGS